MLRAPCGTAKSRTLLRDLLMRSNLVRQTITPRSRTTNKARAGSYQNERTKAMRKSTFLLFFLNLAGVVPLKGATKHGDDERGPRKSPWCKRQVKKQGLKANR